MADKAPSFTIPVRGKEYTVEVNVRANKESAYAGFSATVGEKELYDESLEKLRAKIMAETRRQAVKIDIPYMSLGHTTAAGYQFIRGSLTGVHARTGEYLTRDERGKAGTMPTYSARRLLRPLDADTQAKLIELRTTVDRLQKEIRTIEEANEFNAKEEVEAALAAGESDG